MVRGIPKGLLVYNSGITTTSSMEGMSNAFAIEEDLWNCF